MVCVCARMCVYINYSPGKTRKLFPHPYGSMQSTIFQIPNHEPLEGCDYWVVTGIFFNETESNRTHNI